MPRFHNIIYISLQCLHRGLWSSEGPGSFRWPLELQKHTKTRVFRQHRPQNSSRTHKNTYVSARSDLSCQIRENTETRKNTCVSLHGAAPGCRWGSLWGLFGRLGATWAPKAAQTQKHTKTCVFTKQGLRNTQKHVCFEHTGLEIAQEHTKTRMFRLAAT